METNSLTCKRYKATYTQTELSFLICDVEVIMSPEANEINICDMDIKDMAGQSSADILQFFCICMLTPIPAFVSALTLLPRMHYAL